MLWLKWLHICFVVTWFAAIFYLPRLFVYHAMVPADDELGKTRFKIMERKLFWGIATPSALLTLITGLSLLRYGFSGGWLHTKLALVGFLLGYQLWTYKAMRDFSLERNHSSHVFYRWANEVPVLLLLAIVYLVVFKPF